MAGNNEEDNPLMDTILTPLFNRPNSSIVYPEVGNNNWELKSDNIRLVERAQFGGEDDEDPHRFVNRFLMICDSTKHPQVSNDTVRLRLFPFALKGKALNWLERQPARSIPSWENLSNKFFAEFFSMERYNQMVNDITNFTQAKGETMCAACNRFKDLMRRCPHYPMTNGDQVRIFFNGCKPEIRMVLNGAAGGSIKSMRANETLELIERMVANENEGLSSKLKRGILHLDNSDSALAENKLLSQHMANLTSRLDKMQFSSVQAKAASFICEYCKESHDSNECPTLLSDDPPQQVQVNGIWYDQRPLPPNIPRNQNYPSGSNNFQRRVQGTGLNFKSNNYLQPPPVPAKEPSDLEKLVGQMAQHSNAFMEETRANTKNTQAFIRNLESQIGQLSRQLAERSQGQFPTDTIMNPKEECKSIVTRSGIVITPQEKPKSVLPKKVDEPTPELEHEKEEPTRQDKEEAKEKDKKFPPKLQDPGSFNIPIAVGNTNVGRALCDLGASINLMPLSICKSLGITELKPTMVSLQLADRSLRRPNGIIEDVLVKVDKFIFPADFIVLDMEEESEMPLMLGRPFLATT
ncbi:uncharacterized protein LOC133307102 [Gastrolobium bilobum]|uniref:uncharacterized protein LOC133307102 n=1 Tax=Gastrolobium bilobum TaxID=150636 RepID=UPI002AB01F95|nr:uncharacterized protein LOC133307102 [Gastrolobium bilobum]